MYERVCFVYIFFEQDGEKMTHVEGIGDRLRQKGGGGNQHSYAETKTLETAHHTLVKEQQVSNRVQSGIGIRKMPKRIVEEISVDDEIYPTRPVSPMAAHLRGHYLSTFTRF